jgi:hypothetical protein
MFHQNLKKLISEYCPIDQEEQSVLRLLDKMKKLFKILYFTSVFAMLFASNAHAGEIKDKFFIGADIQETMFTFYSTPGGSVFGGYRWEAFGVELGYTRLIDEHWDNMVIYKSDNLYLDGLWFYPFEQNWEMKALVGAGIFRTRSSDFDLFQNRCCVIEGGSQASLGIRLGLGLQYKLSNSLSTGLDYKFQANDHILNGAINIFSINLTCWF